ncbi:disulfide bond formation protein DsbB [Tepidamorphus gemmatus]|uniref:Disulfide bond formation protein DsbB n=2 Tax=Tepidamorphus gemmatus TaxID=747076 RepID=A0A4R3MGG7_9HYPH|nr:disulfide bond formation protein DsbB [Tepidamorphus gemmatus]
MLRLGPESVGDPAAMRAPAVSIPKSDPVRVAAILVVLVGTATIAGAWIFELMGYAPCPLCLDQRLPYYAGIPLAAVVLVTTRRAEGRRLPRALIGLVGLLFLYGASLAAYHAGVEWKLWAGPSDCAVGTGGPSATGGLLDSLNEAVLIRCDEPALLVFGLSLAAWNAVISLALSAVSLRAALLR